MSNAPHLLPPHSRSGQARALAALARLRCFDALMSCCFRQADLLSSPPFTPLHKKKQALRFGHARLLDSVLTDGLEDAESGCVMGMHAEARGCSFDFLCVFFLFRRTPSRACVMGFVGEKTRGVFRSFSCASVLMLEESMLDGFDASVLMALMRLRFDSCASV